MYKLDNSFAQRPFTVMVVGCGGTGAFVAEGLCRFLPPEASLILVDHDRVEERNLPRQNFFSDDLGRFKSEALAKRIATKYGRPASYSTLPIGLLKIERPDVVIGCVDSGLAACLWKAQCPLVDRLGQRRRLRPNRNREPG
jgi:hypothetical protein